MTKVFRNKEGKKLYPVCSWVNNQHKLYNALDRAKIWEFESDYSDEASAEVDELERLIEVFDNQIVGCIVYATWEDYKKIKDYIAAYDARH